MSEKCEKKCRPLNYFEHFLVSICAFSECVLISGFASLAGADIRHNQFCNRVYAMTTEIKKYKSFI